MKTSLAFTAFTVLAAFGRFSVLSAADQLFDAPGPGYREQTKTAVSAVAPATVLSPLISNDQRPEIIFLDSKGWEARYKQIRRLKKPANAAPDPAPKR